MDSIPQQILLQVILILVNAFFASAEIAFISLNVPMLRKQAEEGNKTAKSLLKMAEEPSGFLSTIQIGITLAGFLGSAFAAENFADYLVNWIYYGIGFTGLSLAALHTISVVIVTIILSYFTLIFGELVPKRIAMQKSYQVAKLACGIIRTIAFIMKPVIAFLSLSTNLMLRLLHLKTEAQEEEVTEDEIRLLVDLGEEKGILDESEKQWIQNVFRLDDMSVKNIMTHSTECICISVHSELGEVEKVIEESGRSRVPVDDKNKNDIIGMLHAKDFFINLRKYPQIKLSDMVRPAYFVPENVSADVVLKDMQKNKINFAVVIDEFGEFSGIVTLEDLLEVIVGNIYDEYDTHEEQVITEDGENRWIIHGNVDLYELKDETGIPINLDDNYDTLNGFIYSYINRIPKDGETFDIEVENYKIYVRKVSNKSIDEVLIVKEEKEQASDSEEDNEQEKS